MSSLSIIHYWLAHLSAIGGCNVIADLSTKICVPGKTNDGHVKVVNMITKIKESKTLVKKLHVMRSAYSIVKNNSNQKWGNDKCPCTLKSIFLQKIL